MLEVTQLLAGRDFARSVQGAERMANFVYLVADRSAGACVLVDPAWDVQGLLDTVAAGKLELTGAIATHGHWDHVGGRYGSMEIEGVAQVAKQARVPIWAHELERERLLATGVAAASLRLVRDDDRLALGSGEIRFLHTPGHTPGSQCLEVGGAVITGDTLFVDECGRVDLAGSDPDAMFASLGKLAELPAGTVVFPGHDYGPTPSATVGDQRRTNPALRARTLEEWRAFLAAP
jgi:glyoxylase-like metal-dependent hydrolase (beta-lactamase superfamily II)